MAILQTKYVDVGVYTIYGTTITGFISTGSISNTQNGSSDVNLDSVFSGADILSFYHSTTSGQGLALSLSGNRANGTFDTLKIGGVSFARTAATHSYNSSTNRTTWTWSSVSSSPFGNTVGADKLVTWETTSATPTYTVTAPTSIDEGSSGTINIATTNLSTGTSLYWSVTSSAQFTGSTTGTVTTDSSGAASFSVTPTADSSTEGALTVTARIRTGSQGGTVVAFDTFVINDTSTTPGGGSTGGQTGGTGSNDYGVEVYGPDNSSVVFGSDLRCTNIYVYDKRTYTANSTHSYTGIANATDSSKIEVILSSGFGFSSASYSFARSSANGGTITVSNGTGQRQIETVVLTIG